VVESLNRKVPKREGRQKQTPRILGKKVTRSVDTLKGQKKRTRWNQGTITFILQLMGAREGQKNKRGLRDRNCKRPDKTLLRALKSLTRERKRTKKPLGREP